MAERDNYTIYETYTLPSKGLIYPKKINPEIKIKSMTTQQEMLRLSPSDLPYKTMSDVIEGCLVEKPEISVYDLCLGDYEFLLHKMRCVTYGPEYKMLVTCPVCGETINTICNLDALKVKEYTKAFDKLKTITLPMTKSVVELNYQTPRQLDESTKRKKEMKKRNPEMRVDPSYLLTLEESICSVDGMKLTEDQVEAFVRNLPMKDANYLLKSYIKLNESLGLETDYECKCTNCGYEIPATFRLTSEFFGPSID